MFINLSSPAEIGPLFRKDSRGQKESRQERGNRALSSASYSQSWYYLIDKIKKSRTRDKNKDTFPLEMFLSEQE